MKKRIIKGILGLGAVLFTSIALTTSAYACFFFMYQPEEPKCLREE
ncbi:cyclic lactone autoinducer peptide [Clostridium sp. KNHs214]|nr:cyclic lactone autoinducer peptide [Clostridium sp. KNHs214]